MKLGNDPTWRRLPLIGLAAVLGLAPAASTSLREQNEALFRAIQEVHGVSDERMATVREIFARSGVAGQGNPAITVHPMSRETCRARWEGLPPIANPEHEAICGANYMVPLYDAATETPEDSRACIDQLEFPNIPCEYPVVWIRASEAALVCEAIGKRLCDAHEWEGACAGSLEAPDYFFDLARGVSPETGVRRMREAHNRIYDNKKVWSYGASYRTGVCAAASEKSATCDGGGWTKCGSNTYPAGSFPECRSALGVYDLNGNAAEHMNLPLDESQMASRGSKDLGHTEMKGSWFIFDRYKAHEDACRWRAPYWHGSRVMDPKSHHNYHLGFRCCKTIEP